MNAHRSWRRAHARDYIGTATILFLALALRIAVALVLRPPPAWDGELYERGARAIARGLGYSTFMFPQRSSDTVPTAYYPVGYPAFIGLLYALFGESLRVIHMAGAAVSATSAALAHRIAFRYVPGWRARAAGLAVALMPGQVLFAPAAMSEPLWGLLITAALYFLTRHTDAPRGRDLVPVGLTLAAATYVRPQALLLAPLLPLALPSAIAPGWRGRLAASALLTALTLAPVLPWTARNCARLGGCALVSTNGGANLAIGAVPRASGAYLRLDARDGCGGVVGEIARDRCWRTVALRAIRAAPWRWARLSLTKLDYTLVRHEGFPLAYLREGGALRMARSRENQWATLLTLPWRALALLALAGALELTHPRRRSHVPLAATIAVLGVIATHAIFFGGDRYHLPLVPLLAVIAAGAFHGRHVQRASFTHEG